MKHLPIKNLLYKRYLESFRQSMIILRYSVDHCYASESKLRELFFFLESVGVNQFSEITTAHLSEYVGYLLKRSAHGGQGALSCSHINGHISILNHFSRYLKSVSEISLPPAPDYLPQMITKQRVILSIEEIQSLYQATDQGPFGLRDRAMLTVYYGCGIRLSEGGRLNTDDVLFERGLLHVRKAKNGHERYIPMTKTAMSYLHGYITIGRAAMLADRSHHKQLFISYRGSALSTESLYCSLVALCKKAGITKQVGMHTLRHSIATHLLQKNMDLDKIALFLGHRCLDSTQIYTHIAGEESVENLMPKIHGQKLT
jgi:integrase/recombinase XerD